MGLLSAVMLLVRRVQNPIVTCCRHYRVKKKWATTLPHVASSRFALQYFDTNYSLQFQDLWPSIRISLLSEQKYGALLNNFSRQEMVAQHLTSLHSTDFLSEARQVIGESPEMMDEDRLSPEPSSTSMEESGRDTVTSLSSTAFTCYTFPRGDISRFPSPRVDMSGLLEYYLMDAASLLPVLALDVQPGHSVLDLCAAPGGKTLALLMQNCRFLAANDKSASRTQRLHKVLHSFIPRHLFKEDRVRVTSWDGTEWPDQGVFDRVLVDAPCTADRHSLLEEENNIFHRMRMKERQMLPALQTALLVSGLRAVAPGGDVVYATCSLSQLQNELVVERALDIADSEHGIRASIRDLRPFQEIFRNTFNFHTNCRIGELVVPHLTANFGPMYFCKLRRAC
ncbi:5-methylcytosine rRNA methyltransferase NSUN4 [Hyperolius riggenbachi]|uniref:5-methylcytosine rRNA methyltransferase NSUN4 n=1 Tax=Hyperolius riggenbachi TaxID=752182 RepID=UPI0035A2EF7C